MTSDINMELVKILNLLHDKAQTANGMRLHAGSGKPTADMHYFEGSAKAYADAFLILHNMLVPMFQDMRSDLDNSLLDLKFKYGDTHKISHILRSTQGELP